MANTNSFMIRMSGLELAFVLELLSGISCMTSRFSKLLIILEEGLGSALPSYSRSCRDYEQELLHVWA